MTVRTKVIGRLPQNKREWDPNYVNPSTGQQGYGLKFRVFQYGCELESKIENNTYEPFSWDGDQTFILDVSHWELCSGNPKVWAAGNPKPATTGTTGDYPYNGMGRVVIPKNMVNVGTSENPDYVNQLTQDMFYKGEVGSRVPNTNTIFVIQYDFVLAEDVTIPAGSILDFQGGSISAGGNNADTITGNGTVIRAGVAGIFNANITIAGTWDADKAYPEWFGAVADGVTDDTEAIQKAYDVFDNIYFPAASYAQAQVYPRSNTRIEFSEGCHIKASRALIDTVPGVPGESMYSIHDVSNITIIGNNAIIDMRRADFPEEESGESRHCFRIRGTRNLYIENVSGNNSFGDGFCLAYPGAYNNKNITLRGCISDNNRRQGLSIVDGENIYVENCVFSNTNGTSPSAGIDIEPNYLDGYVINNINITNCRSKNNNGAGLLIAASLKTGANNKNININVNGFISEGDAVGVSLQNYSLHDCYGKICFNNIHVEGRGFLTVGAWGGNPNVKTSFNDCSFVKTVTTGSISGQYNNVISFNLIGAIYDHYIGDITLEGLDIGCTVEEKPAAIINFYVNYTSEGGKRLRNFYCRNINVAVDAMYNDTYGPVRHSTPFDTVQLYSIEFAYPYGLSGFSKYCAPYADAYRLSNGSYDFTNYAKIPNHVSRFVYEYSGGGASFVVDENIPFYDEDGNRLSALSMTDPETVVVGGRNATVGEWIEFIFKSDGCHILRMTPLMSKYIVKTPA